jgi:hypothetical protein
MIPSCLQRSEERASGKMKKTILTVTLPQDLRDPIIGEHCQLVHVIEAIDCLLKVCGITGEERTAISCPKIANQDLGPLVEMN